MAAASRSRRLSSCRNARSALRTQITGHASREGSGAGQTYHRSCGPPRRRGWAGPTLTSIRNSTTRDAILPPIDAKPRIGAGQQVTPGAGSPEVRDILGAVDGSAMFRDLTRTGDIRMTRGYDRA
jgi:hypothetical protein